MTHQDLDRLEKDRIGMLRKQRPVNLDQVFLSERVLGTIQKPKLFMEGYRTGKVLAVLPFTQNVYVSICRGCIRNADDFKSLLSLTENGLIIPVLMNPYSAYPDKLVDVLKGRDHVSMYQSSFYQQERLNILTDGTWLCAHCIRRRKQEILADVPSGENSSILRKNVNLIFQRLYPYYHYDARLIDSAAKCVASGDAQQLSQLAGLCEPLKSMRLAQIWSASMPISAFDIADLPTGISAEVDAGVATSLALRRHVVEGLGLHVPLDIPIDKYAEIVKEYQPRISKIADDIVDESNTRSEQRYQVIQKELFRINAEIARIKTLKRQALIETTLDFFRNNRSLAMTALVAGVLGVGGSLVGCLGAAATGVSVHVARRKGWIRKSVRWPAAGPSAWRLARLIHRDLQPHIEKLMAGYLGASLPSVSVLALREQMAADVKKMPKGRKTRPAKAA